MLIYFPYGVAHRKKNTSLPKNDKKVLLQEQMNYIGLIVAAWSTVLKRILSLHRGLAADCPNRLKIAVVSKG